MAFYHKDIDPAFHNAGANAGLEIWCVEKNQLVPIPKSSQGRFYSGSAYVVLSTTLPRDGPPEHYIHYWLGKDADEMEAKMVSDKALELDAGLGSCTVQFREVQGTESERFLSYFKPCVLPVEGVYSSKSGNRSDETYKVTLLACKGEHVVHVKEVPFSRSSLNHDDVFILDTASKIFLFSGCNSTIQERAKALEVVQYITENKHNGNCDVATLEDGKFVGDADVGEFWSFFGGYAPIPKDSPSGDQKQSDSTSVKLYWITLQGKLNETGSGLLNKEMLEINKCYMLDCGAEIFVWVGRYTSVTERKTSIAAVEDFLRKEGRSTGTHLTLITEGLETAIFRSYFENWPQTVELKLYEEGKGKVAAIFKHQGYDVKEIPEEEDFQPYINSRGIPKVWRVNGDELSLLPSPEQTRFFSGDCYIVQYTYPGNGRDENLYYAWIGLASAEEERVHAISHLNSLVDSAKGFSVSARIVEGKEPPLFLSILRTLIVFKGGMSNQYKNLITENGVADETYVEDKTALFRVQGTNPQNMQAIQVKEVSSSLNSSYCYILQHEKSIFTWIGNLSPTRDHDLLDRMLAFINPAWLPLSVREGNEPDTFWNALGGKAEYSKEKEIKRHPEDPHLFLLSTTNEGDFKVKEIYNFTQDDLITEDVILLNCSTEVYVWIGNHSKVKSKQQAFDIGLKFLERDIMLEGLSSDTPIYVVREGQEPDFFTRFFEWDSSKANMHGNSFERKLAILKGNPHKLSNPARDSRRASFGGNTPHSLRSRSVSFDGRGSTTTSSRSSNVSGFTRRPSNGFSSPTPIAMTLFSESSPNQGQTGSTLQRTSSESAVIEERNGNGNEVSISSIIYPYEQLTVVSKDPLTDIDPTKREAYLSDQEFEEKFKMTRKAFYQLAKWRQNKLKMSLDLF
ncbi:villin-1 [Rutidosis leptorrhynchoides]|uniref:villin-1 n=1 Tax=Rutidosis leptorrhynchoides TaxID=125765 RepID=UPI003A9A415D